MSDYGLNLYSGYVPRILFRALGANPQDDDRVINPSKGERKVTLGTSEIGEGQNDAEAIETFKSNYIHWADNDTSVSDNISDSEARIAAVVVVLAKLYALSKDDSRYGALRQGIAEFLESVIKDRRLDSELRFFTYQVWLEASSKGGKSATVETLTADKKKLLKGVDETTVLGSSAWQSLLEKVKCILDELVVTDRPQSCSEALRPASRVDRGSLPDLNTVPNARAVLIGLLGYPDDYASSFKDDELENQLLVRFAKLKAVNSTEALNIYLDITSEGGVALGSIQLAADRLVDSNYCFVLARDHLLPAVENAAKYDAANFNPIKQRLVEFIRPKPRLVPERKPGLGSPLDPDGYPRRFGRWVQWAWGRIVNDK